MAKTFISGKIYYGAETRKALKNFPFSYPRVRMDFIYGITVIKQAAAAANYQAKNISRPVAQAIGKACGEILVGKFDNQFPLTGIQGGAGTAINMNVNEVIAARATELLGNKIFVHPNDHVNRSQSTNDVNPSAVKIAASRGFENLDKELGGLILAFEKKAVQFAGLLKLGRTHLQDAVPTTLGFEFGAYAENLKEQRKNLNQAAAGARVLNLGGTAIGNSANAGKKYISALYRQLNRLTRGRFEPAKNLMSRTSGQSDFLVLSQALTALCVDLSKIANDLKFLSSGPGGGIGEIILPELQKGSSIMPGKVNPVLPETVNQLYYFVSGNNLAIERAVEGAQLELGVMLPVIAACLLESVSLAAEVVGQFNRLCVARVKADARACRRHLENSTAFSVFLTPEFGYDKVSNLVKESVANHIPFKQAVLESKLMKEKDWQQFVKKISREAAAK